MIMNNLILEFLVQFCHISVYPAKLVTECMLFFISWLVQNCIIFRQERRLQKAMDWQKEGITIEKADFGWND